MIELPDNKSELQDLIFSLISEKENLNSQFLSLKESNQELRKENTAIAEENKFISSKSSIIEKENKKLLLQVLELTEQLRLLRAKQFGKSSEKIKSTESNIEHQLEESEISLGINAEDKPKPKGKNKNKARRKKIPKSIPRKDIRLEAPKECESCGSTSLRLLGEDISEKLDYVPASFIVLRYIRPRCVCKECESMNQAYPASGAIDKGKAGCGLLAHIMIQKYCNHLPLYRQSEMYERESIEIPRSTMASWVGQCAGILNPLIDVLRKKIFSAAKLHGDDTPVKVLGKGAKKIKQGRIWVYVLDERPCNGKTPPAACYYYSPDRKGERPESHLKDFKGILQADAYAGYNGVYITKEHPERSVYEASCWAHVRRKFYEITVASKNAKVAYEVVAQIGKLYDVESKVRYKNPQERFKARQKESKKLVTELFDAFKNVLPKLSKKGSTTKAINYALNNEVALKRFLDDGTIEIDNNIAERALRAVAVGRKNWLFAGSDEGGETAANIYSLIETAKLNNINPWKYLKKVLSVIQDYNYQKLEDLLPWNITLD